MKLDNGSLCDHESRNVYLKLKTNTKVKKYIYFNTYLDY